jgi:hypothetical protein
VQSVLASPGHPVESGNTIQPSRDAPNEEEDPFALEHWVGSHETEDIADYPLPEEEDLTLEVSQENSDDEDFKVAVRDSIREADEREAKRAAVEVNLKENQALDEWLEAVKDVEDGEPAFVRQETASQKSAPKDIGKGKGIVIDLSDDE